MRASGPFIVTAACPHDRRDTCALLVTVEQRAGRRVAIKIDGDPNHQTTRGALCTKVSRHLECTYHADRVLYPLKRVGPKVAKLSAIDPYCSLTAEKCRRQRAPFATGAARRKEAAHVADRVKST